MQQSIFPSQRFYQRRLLEKGDPIAEDPGIACQSSGILSVPDLTEGFRTVPLHLFLAFGSLSLYDDGAAVVFVLQENIPAGQVRVPCWTLSHTPVRQKCL